MFVQSGADATIPNFEGKTAVDVARAMNSGSTTTTGSAGCSSVLFMVMTAAGLDPLTESTIGEVVGGEPMSMNTATATATTAVVSLLDDSSNGIESGMEQSYLTGTPSIWVIVQDGHLLSTAVYTEVPIYNKNSTTSSNSNMHKKTAEVGKLSRRLRFVRRSILGRGDETEPTTPTPTTTSAATTNSTTTATITEWKVEVFHSRQEAEERVRTVHLPAALNTAANICRTTTTELNTISGIQNISSIQSSVGVSTGAGSGSGGSPRWGSNMRHPSTASILSDSSHVPTESIANHNTNNNTTGTIVVDHNTNNTNINTNNTNVPSIQFQTARIDPAQLSRFMSSVPHFYPTELSYSNNSNSSNTKNSTTGNSNSYTGNGYTISSSSKIAGDDDPLWQSYQHTHSLQQSTIHTNTDSANSNNYSGSSSHIVCDTSMSNKPVKLLRKTSNNTVEDQSSNNYNNNSSSTNSSKTNEVTNIHTTNQDEPLQSQRQQQQQEVVENITQNNPSNIVAPAPVPVPVVVEEQPVRFTPQEVAAKSMEITTDMEALHAQVSLSLF